MPKNVDLGANPAILKWAREIGGFSLQEVARRTKRSVEQIEEWECGISFPTYPQLEKLAYEIYKRPLALFFFPEPPSEISPRSEFRSLPDSDLEELTPHTRNLIREAHAYQLSLADAFGGVNPSRRKLWLDIGLAIDGDVIEMATDVRLKLQIAPEKLVRCPKPEDALLMWRRAIEESGIFVFKNSFSQKEISGFCLADGEFPLIYLNNSTTKTRQIFSLLHELAHLLLDTSAISKFDSKYLKRLPSDQEKIEVFCNAFAAELLIPSQDLDALLRARSQEFDAMPDSFIEEVASKYNASREAVLRRCLDRGLVSMAFYARKASEWTSQISTVSSGSGDYYATTKSYLSEKFTQQVVSKHYQQQLSVEAAADLLGIKPRNFAGIEERVMRAAG